MHQGINHSRNAKLNVGKTNLFVIGIGKTQPFYSDGYGLDIEDENIFFCNDNKWNISRAMECQGSDVFV